MPAEPALTAERLTVSYGSFRAVQDVNLTCEAKAVLGIAGSSGAGKTTLARCLAGFRRPDSGTVRCGGADLYGGTLTRTRVQLVQQDAFHAFHPRWTVRECVREPADIQGQGAHQERDRRVLEMLSLVRLPEQCANRRPSELSGGQRRRVALARALMIEPAVLILDETLANLDLPVQTELARLVRALCTQAGVAVVLISHDPRVLRKTADHVLVLDQGRAVESGTAAAVLGNPQTICARELVSAMPGLPC